MLSIIQQADPVASRQTTEADVALLTTAESRVDRELEREPELALQVRLAIGAAYRNRGEFKRASLVLRKGIEQARTSLPPTNLELIGAFVQMADDHVIDSRKAREDLENAIGHLRTLGPSAQPLLADALLAQIRILRWNAPWKHQLVTGQEAYRVALATGDEGRILIAAGDLTLTLLNIYQGNAKQALPLISEAYERAMRSGKIEPSDPRRILAMSWHGMALFHAGQTAEGLKLSRQAVDEARKYHGATSHVTEVALTNLFLTVAPTGEDRDATLAAIREAYEISVKRELSGSGNRNRNKMFLVMTLINRNMREEAERVMQESPPLMKLVPGSLANAPTETPLHYHFYEAEIRERLGDFETAERLAEEAVQFMETEGAHIIAWRIYDVLAGALFNNGKLERAESFAVAALENDGVEYAPTPGRIAWHRLQLCLIRLDLAKYQSALELAEEALALFSEERAPSAREVSHVNYRRGRALLGLGRLNEAIENLSAVSRLFAEVRSRRRWDGPSLLLVWAGTDRQRRVPARGACSSAPRLPGRMSSAVITSRPGC